MSVHLNKVIMIFETVAGWTFNRQMVVTADEGLQAALFTHLSNLQLPRYRKSTYDQRLCGNYNDKTQHLSNLSKSTLFITLIC